MHPLHSGLPSLTTEAARPIQAASVLPTVSYHFQRIYIGSI